MSIYKSIAKRKATYSVKSIRKENRNGEWTLEYVLKIIGSSACKLKPQWDSMSPYF